MRYPQFQWIIIMKSQGKSAKKWCISYFLDKLYIYICIHGYVILYIVDEYIDIVE